MTDTGRTPGITRAERLSGEGLERLERQLQRGGQISDMVLEQWIKRYGEVARTIIARHGRLPGVKPGAD